MADKKIPRSFGTHDGTFHADEVTACALLLLFDLIDKDKIVRTRDTDKLNKCEFVCDVGGIYDSKRKLFDHHQADYKGLFSSAGMVLQYLKDIEILKPNEYQFFNDSLIIGVDAVDNGRESQRPGYCSYSDVITNFTPIQYDPDPEDEKKAFSVAFDFALVHLHRLWDRYHYVQSCRQIVADAMARDKDCLMFDRGIPWKELFFELGGVNHPARFVIMSSGNHWNLRCIPPSFEDLMNVRVPLPEEWAGLCDKELKNVTGIPGAVFCHKGRFISVWETKEDAIKAMRYTITKMEETS